MSQNILLDASNKLSEVDSVIEAVFMAASAIGDKNQCDAIQFVYCHAQTLLADASALVDSARMGAYND